MLLKVLIHYTRYFPVFWGTFFFLASSLCGATSSLDTPEMIAQGKKIYEEGVLISGEPLLGKRPGDITVKGAEAACILCHRRSGMGLPEGASWVPPITGPALFENFRQSGHQSRLAAGIAYRNRPAFSRPAYDSSSLSHAIRQGISPTGHRFQYLMPRYVLDDANMASLIAYLRKLSATPSPGTDTSMVHFATVVSPGHSPAKRQSVTDVLQACLAERQPLGQQWKLHVWELAGLPETWGPQLDAWHARQNVFAMVSGLGLEEWGAVHDFCERQGIPCLFPNVDKPGRQAESIYNFYFSKGVMLEAEVIASYLAEHVPQTPLKRVIQLAPSDGAGAKAAAVLRRVLDGTGLEIESRTLAQLGTGGEALRDLRATDALVVWLPEAQLAALAKLAPEGSKAGVTFISGWLGGVEKAPLGVAWKKQALLVYPFDTPNRWEVRRNFNLQPWLQKQGIAGSDHRLLGNTLAACNLLTEGMLRLRGVMSRDYLVDLTENYPVSMGNAPGPQAFPRFSLGPGQRFSSKGAYLLRFVAPDWTQLEPVGDWIVP